MSASPPPVMTDELPVLVRHDDLSLLPASQADAGPLPSVAPTLAPLPTLADDLTVPAHTPFTYQTMTALTAAELDAISTFHAQHMQGGGLAAHIQGLAPDQKRMHLKRAQQEASYVHPLIEKQYHLACVGVDGPTSQEARSVQANLHWVTQLLAMQV